MHYRFQESTKLPDGAEELFQIAIPNAEGHCDRPEPSSYFIEAFQETFGDKNLIDGKFISTAGGAGADWNISLLIALVIIKESGKALQELAKGLSEMETSVRVWKPHLIETINGLKDTLIILGEKLSSFLERLKNHKLKNDRKDPYIDMKSAFVICLSDVLKKEDHIIPYLAIDLSEIIQENGEPMNLDAGGRRDSLTHHRRTYMFLFKGSDSRFDYNYNTYLYFINDKGEIIHFETIEVYEGKY